MTEQRKCPLDPMGSGVHSEDMVAVYNGHVDPVYVCGYHAAFWPELVYTAR